MKSFRPLLIVAWCAVALILIVRGEALWALGDRLESDPDDYHQLAFDLRAGYSYSTMLLIDADAPHVIRMAAWRPPLYPGLLALIIPWDTTNFPGWVAGIQLSLGALTVLAVYAVSRMFGLTRQAACIAAGLVLLDPILIHQSAEVMTETLAAFLVAICLIALVSGCAANDRTKSSLFAGLMLGAATLCRPTFLVWTGFILAAFVAIDIFHRRFPGRAMLLGLAFAVAVSPWTVRNWAVLGEPIITTTHGGYTFYRANNPLYYEHLRTAPWGTVWDTDRFDELWRSQMSSALRKNQNARFSGKALEVLLDSLSYEASFNAIRNEPGMFVYASAVRLSRFFGMVPWQTDPHESPRMRRLRYGVGAFYVCVFALALVGMFTLGRKLVAPPWLWGTLLAMAFTLVHTFYWTDMRMRAPLVPVIAMVAAVGAERIGKRIGRRSAPESPGTAIPGLGEQVATH